VGFYLVTPIFAIIRDPDDWRRGGVVLSLTAHQQCYTELVLVHTDGHN
jgi:hypothetical protein